MTELWNEFVGILSGALRALADAFAMLGDHRWAATIVVFTLAIQTLLLPLAIKQIRSMQAMQRLGPELKRLQQKHRSDRQRLMQETQALYQREGVNPLGGCLPMIAQMPVLFAMFYVIRDLAEHPDVGRMPFLGIGDLSQEAFRSVGGWILLLLMTGVSILSTRQLSGAADPRQQRIQQLLPLFFLFIMFRFPTGLVLYWTTQNVYRFVQQRIMLRGQDIALAEKGAKGAEKGSPKTKPVAAVPRPAPVRRNKPRRRR